MATKKTTTSKAAVKKPAAKKPTTKPRKVAAKKRPAKNQSLLKTHVGLRREETEFMTFRITRQTLYWLVLGAIVILFTWWLTQLQADIQNLYDQIDANTAEAATLE